jgi:cysteine desulfuration protein SufE
MSSTIETLPPRLREIIEEFSAAEGREKLELLLEFSESLPPLPERLRDKTAEMEQVHECMTPVFVDAERAGEGLSFFFEIPASSPTVRGYAALLLEGVNGSTPSAVLAIPTDFYRPMGLEAVLTPQRMNGINAILAHMKRLALREMEQQ